MKMKTGISIVAVLAVAAGTWIFFNEKNKKKNQFNYITNESLNKIFDKDLKIHSEAAFSEFFNKNSIKEAYNRYEKYLDLGLKKDDAFKAVVEDDRNI